MIGKPILLISALLIICAPDVFATGPRDCTTFAGTDAGAKITACISDLPATGGTADARGFEGSQTISSTITLGSKPLALLLGAANYSFTGTGPVFDFPSTSTGPTAIIGMCPKPELWTVTGKCSVITNTVNGSASIRITNSASIDIEGVAFEGSTSTGPHILLDGGSGVGQASQRIQIQNDTFHGKDNAVIFQNTVYQVNIFGNMMNAQNAEGILLDYSGGSGDTSIYILENWIRSSGGDGIKGSGAQGVVNLAVQRNQISNITTANKAAINIIQASGVTVADNDIESISGSGTSDGIRASGSAFYIYANTIIDARGTTVRGSGLTKSVIGPNRILKGSSTATVAITLDAISAQNIIWNHQTDFAGLFSDAGSNNVKFDSVNDAFYPPAFLQFQTLLSNTANPAGSGSVRLASSDAIALRNNANSGDVNGLSKDASDVVLVGGSAGVNTKGVLTVATGIGQGTGKKHGRVTTGSIAGGANAPVSLTWSGAAFANTSYTVTCLVEEPTASASTLRFHHLQSKSTTSIVARVINDGASAKTGTLNCSAEHD